MTDTPAQGRRPVIVFDIGGVLIDWNPRHLYRKMFPDADAVEAFLEEVGFEAWNLEQDRGRTFAEAVMDAVARFPHHREALEAYDVRWPEMVEGAIDGTVAILEALKRDGYTVHAITNFNQDKFRVARELFPFLNLFDTVLVSGEIGLIKPDPEIFRLFLRQTGLAATDCVYIDDNRANVDSAAALGFHALHFRSPEVLAAELRRLGVEVPPA